MQQIVYYTVMFGLSFVLSLLYVFQWRKQFEVHMTAIFILLPIVNLSYLIMYTGENPETAVAMLKMVYVGGCFLPWLTMMCVLQLCCVNIKRWMRILTFSLNSVLYFAVLTIGRLPLYYKSLSLERVGGVWVQNKEYGPVHMIYSVFIISYLIADISAIVYTYRTKKQVSRRVLFLLFIPIPISVLGYFANHAMMSRGFEIMPLTYVMAQVTYLLITQRMVLYNVSEMVIESMVRSGDIGFISIDSKGRYLGSNETAKEFIPELSSLITDSPIRNAEEIKETVGSWLNRFWRDPDMGKFFYTRKNEDGEERIYSVNVSYLKEGTKRRGYQIFLEDDTQNQKYIRLMDQYNSDLQAEVASKTERIIEMHDRLILGMAAMVESRDNSTGGHIRRTSEGVRILVETIRENDMLPITDKFGRDLIKAAPMHDLGKIAVDDAILRKAGPFTPEERRKMQEHSAEGARIVHEILKDTDDEEFRRLAENVAHFHHERVDGKGYPDGLKGDAIPLEARIMSIADVYDALVSKRVYKEKFSFEKANSIIMEGMGTQFDDSLKACYEAARPKLEAFYASQ